MRNNKRAQLGDMIFTLLTITSIALTMLVAAYTYYQIQTPINSADIASNESIEAYNSFEKAFPMFDLSMFFIVCALIIGLLISTLFIPTSPIFVVVNIVGFAVLVFLGGVFANLYGAMLDINETGTTTNITMSVIAQQNYPITTFIVKNLPYIGAVLVLFASIIMYAKSRGDYG